MVFGKQDTHVDRAGRSLIRDTLDEQNIPFTVSLTPSMVFFPKVLARNADLMSPGLQLTRLIRSLWRYKPNTPLSGMSQVKGDGTLRSPEVYSRV